MSTDFQVKYQPGRLIIKVEGKSYAIKDRFLRELMDEQKAVKISWKSQEEDQSPSRFYAYKYLGYDD